MNWKHALSGMVAGVLSCAAVTSAWADDVVIKVWSRADRSGPLRAGNLVAAGDTLNKMLAAAGADKRVKIELNETNAKGYDDDALDLMKAFAVDKGPDIFVLAHEWTGAFAEAGYAQNLEDHIDKNPELYGDIIVPLWQAVSYKGARYGVPQDSEVRMYFLNNDKLRKMGKTDKEIAALPAKVDAGEFTAYDLCDLAGQAVQKGVVKYGILHRPNAGPDFQMLIESFGLVPYDKDAAKLQVSKAALKDFFTWVKYCVDKKALSATNTSMSWDAIEQASFGEGRGAGLFPRRLARYRSDQSVEPQRQGRLPAQDHLDQRAGGQEGRQAGQPVAPDRLRRVSQIEEQGAGRVHRRARQPADSQHAPFGDDEPHAHQLRRAGDAGGRR